MARQRDQRDMTERENPYGQLPDDEKYDDFDAELDENDDYDEDDGYDDEPSGRRGRSGGRGSSGGFLSTGLGRALVIVIALLLILIIVLFAVRFIRGGQGGEGTALPAAQPTVQPTAAQVTAFTATPEPTAPVSMVFGPAATDAPQMESEPTAAPTLTATPVPTDTPEPTATPLPIILTNTPTPSPTVRPTATPTASPTPSPTPTPTPTPRADVAKGETNREANLREGIEANAKVKQKVKKGQAVTIHESVLDSKGKVWYNVTVDDLAVDGWMRDYVVNVEGNIAKPTATPKASASPSAGGKAEATPTPVPEEGVIGTGKTNRDANLRQTMNGKVLSTLSKGKRLLIFGVSVDKKGNVWYEVRAENGKTRGYMRDYVVTLDDGVELELPEGAKKASATPTPAAAKKATPQPEKATPTPNPLLDREVIGRAVTNREANVRTKPIAGAKLVRQLSKGVEVLVLAKYEDESGAVWYEISTESGKTHGFARDYVLNMLKLDRSAEMQTFDDEGEG